MLIIFPPLSVTYSIRPSMYPNMPEKFFMPSPQIIQNLEQKITSVRMNIMHSSGIVANMLRRKECVIPNGGKRVEHLFLR